MQKKKECVCANASLQAHAIVLSMVSKCTRMGKITTENPFPLLEGGNTVVWFLFGFCCGFGNACVFFVFVL